MDDDQASRDRVVTLSLPWAEAGVVPVLEHTLIARLLPEQLVSGTSRANGLAREWPPPNDVLVDQQPSQHPTGGDTKRPRH